MANKQPESDFSRSMKTVFLYRGGRERRLPGALAGTCPTEFFYGAIELLNHGYDVDVVDINYSQSSSDLGAAEKALDLLFKAQFLPSRVYGSLMHRTWQLLPRLRAADTIVATTPGIAFAAAILKSMYRFPGRILAIQLGLADYQFSRRRSLLNGYFLKRMHNIVYTETERRLMLEKYRLPAGDIVVNQFGVDTTFWQTDRYDHKGYILAVGSDGMRDYELLLQAAEKIQKRFIIVTSKTIDHSVPENVEVIKSDWLSNSVSDEDIRGLYAGASLVVTPLKRTTRPSGQSVSLQAMSCGRPVIISEIEGLWSEKVLCDGVNVMLTRPENLDALVCKINELISDESKCLRIGNAARKAVSMYANTGSWASRMIKIFEY